MKVRGCDVHVITCDGLYQPCALRRGQQDCAFCQAAIAGTLRQWELPSMTIGSLLTPHLIDRAEQWAAALPDDQLAIAVFDDLPIGNWALSTIKTHFRVSTNQQLLNPLIIPVHRRFVRDTLLTFWAIDLALEKYRIDAVFLFNARFYPYRAAFEAARRRSIGVLVHERGRVGNTFGFFDNETCLSLEPARQLTRSWADVPLSAAEIKKIEQYFAQKRRGINSNWPAFYESVEAADVYGALDIPRGSRLIALFTSSSDEFGHLPEYSLANRQFELIDAIAAEIEQSDLYLVVRHHPAMGGVALTGVDVSGLYAAYKHALRRTDRVRIVMPSDALSSPALLPYLTAAIAPFSSIASETTAFGIPTLVSNISDVIFDEAYILPDLEPGSLKRALSFITSPAAEMTADRLRCFYRTFYGMFFRPSVEFKSIGIKEFHAPVAHANSLDALEPGRDPALDRVCGNLLQHEPVFEQPGTISEDGSAGAEDEFVAQQLELIKDRQRAIADHPSHSVETKVPLAVLLDSSIPGVMTTSQWRCLPKAEELTVRQFAPAQLPKVKHALRAITSLVRADLAQKTFLQWSQGLIEAISCLTEDYILVTSPAAQYHDASITTALQIIKGAAQHKSVITVLPGWLSVSEEIAPVRINKESIGSVAEYELDRAGNREVAGRMQHGLAFTAVRRDWLVRLLKRHGSSIRFQRALMRALADSPQSKWDGNPVYLLH
jgi:hypothetical protein